MFKINWCVLLILALLIGESHAQTDSKILSAAYDNSKDAYFRALGPELGLYNGVSYKEFIQHNNDEGQPYFETDQWVEGEIYYNGMRYENVPLLYDVVNDKVVIDHSGKLELISEKVKYFILNGHRFFRLTIPNTNSLIRTGFFELLYDGQSKLYAKWQKKRVEVIEVRDIQARYEDQNRIYIKKENKFHVVKTKSSVLQVLEDKKAILQRYCKENHLKFKDHRIESIAKMMAFYESGAK